MIANFIKGVQIKPLTVHNFNNKNYYNSHEVRHIVIVLSKLETVKSEFYDMLHNIDF